jgi:dsRNA-specific ribonuclease
MSKASIQNVDVLISRVEKIFKHTFRNKVLCAEALNMKRRDLPIQVGGISHVIARNRELELVGDSIIDTVLVKRWWEARDEQGTIPKVAYTQSILTDTGQRPSFSIWNALRRDLAGNVGLGKRGQDLGLDTCVLTADGTSVSRGMVADTFEAVIGAIYIEEGENALAAVSTVLDHTGVSINPWLSEALQDSPTICAQTHTDDK